MKKIARFFYQYLNVIDRYNAAFCLRKFSKKQLVVNSENAKSIINPKGSQICHILAAGYTLTDNLVLINDSDLVWGSSISPLANKKLTHYFCELYANNTPFYNTVYSMYKEMLPALRESGTKIIHKNLWQNNNKKDIFNEISDPEDLNVDESFLRFYSIKRRNYLINKYLIEKKIFQCCASNILFLQLACYSGCKKIVFHGVDGGGRYFIENGFDNSYLEESTLDEVMSFYRCSGKHMSMQSPIHSQFESLKIISKKMGIEVYCSSKKSPLSAIFPVYKSVKG